MNNFSMVPYVSFPCIFSSPICGLQIGDIVPAKCLAKHPEQSEWAQGKAQHSGRMVGVGPREDGQRGDPVQGRIDGIEGVIGYNGSIISFYLREIW